MDFLLFLERLDDLLQLFLARVVVILVVNLHHGGQRAATQAVHGF